MRLLVNHLRTQKNYKKKASFFIFQNNINIENDYDTIEPKQNETVFLPYVFESDSSSTDKNNDLIDIKKILDSQRNLKRNTFLELSSSADDFQKSDSTLTTRDIRKLDYEVPDNYCGRCASKVLNYNIQGQPKSRNGKALFRMNTEFIKSDNAWTFLESETNKNTLETIWTLQNEDKTWPLSEIIDTTDEIRLQQYNQLLESLDNHVITSGDRNVLGVIHLMNQHSTNGRRLSLRRIGYYGNVQNFSERNYKPRNEESMPASHIGVITGIFKFPIEENSFKEHFENIKGIHEEELQFVENRIRKTTGKWEETLTENEKFYTDYGVTHQNGKRILQGSLLEKVVLLKRSNGKASYNVIGFSKVKDEVLLEQEMEMATR